MQELSELIESAQREFAEANAAAALEDAKARYLGKTGSLTMLMKELGRLAPEERRARGQEINRAKQQVEAALNARREALAEEALAAKLAQESIDVTLPGAWTPRAESIPSCARGCELRKFSVRSALMWPMVLKSRATGLASLL